MYSLSDAVEHLHRKDVIHRDIKPANVILRDDSDTHTSPVLIDFGSAKLNASETEVVTQSPSFSAPESDISPASDIYSLGATAYAAAVGSTPPQWAAFQNGEANFADLDACAAKGALSAEIIKVIKRAMALDPADRFSSAAAMRDAFDTFLTPDEFTTINVRKDPSPWAVAKSEKVAKNSKQTAPADRKSSATTTGEVETSKDTSPSVFRESINWNLVAALSVFVAVFVAYFLATNQSTESASRIAASSLGTLTDVKLLRTEDVPEIEQYYTFKVGGTKEKFVELNLWGFHANADIDMILEHPNGVPIAKSSNVGAAPEKIEQILRPGTYVVRLKRTGTASTGTFRFSGLALGEMISPNPSRLYGTFVERHSDYEIYRADDQCVAVTVAKSALPSLGWRKYRPYLNVGVTRSDNLVSFNMDRASKSDGTDIFQAGSVRASVIGRGSVPARFKDFTLRPLTNKYCKADWCVDNEAVRGFRRGKELVINGRTPDGDSATIRYSLLGYTRAMQRINQICGAKANWIWNQ